MKPWILIAAAMGTGCSKPAGVMTTHERAPSEASTDAAVPSAQAVDASHVDASRVAPDASVALPPRREDDDAGAAPVPRPSSCVDAETEGATSDCLRPTLSPDHYRDEALRYFDTLDVDADRASVPRYSELVARWEWPPWLLLTGYGRQTMERTADILRRIDPSTVPRRDCRAFDVQPFARCYVEFEYEGGPCPIYEEFTFNDQGETTFIEAWSNLPGMLPMPDAGDTWAEGPNVQRLSTRVPGLGNAEGRIDLDSEWMARAAESDPDVAEFQRRARNQWWHWTMEYAQADSSFFARGCGW
jgi:hypothetical protein